MNKMNDTKNENIVPAMIKSWVDDMLDPSANAQHKHNRYLMLEYTHRYIGKALNTYTLTTGKK